MEQKNYFKNEFLKQKIYQKNGYSYLHSKGFGRNLRGMPEEKEIQGYLQKC